MQNEDIFQAIFILYKNDRLFLHTIHLTNLSSSSGIHDTSWRIYQALHMGTVRHKAKYKMFVATVFNMEITICYPRWQLESHKAA